MRRSHRDEQRTLARRALPAHEDDVLDDMQRLQVALEQLATDWTATAVSCGDTLIGLTYELHAQQLRNTLRRHR